MKRNILMAAIPHKLAPVLFILTMLVVFPAFFFAQGSDYLSSEEIELIRENQEIDKRMGVYVRAIERRLLALKGPEQFTAAERARIEKESENWGGLPKGSREKLLSDIEDIIDEAISKIDDVADRDMESTLFSKAVHVLADGARDFITELNLIKDKSKEAREIALISSSISYCNDIIEASSKTAKPPEDGKSKKKKQS